eukprot:403377176
MHNRKLQRLQPIKYELFSTAEPRIQNRNSQNTSPQAPVTQEGFLSGIKYKNRSISQIIEQEVFESCKNLLCCSPCMSAIDNRQITIDLERAPKNQEERISDLDPESAWYLNRDNAQEYQNQAFDSISRPAIMIVDEDYQEPPQIIERIVHYEVPHQNSVIRYSLPQQSAQSISQITPINSFKDKVNLISRKFDSIDFTKLFDQEYSSKFIDQSTLQSSQHQQSLKREQFQDYQPISRNIIIEEDVPITSRIVQNIQVSTYQHQNLYPQDYLGNIQRTPNVIERRNEIIYSNHGYESDQNAGGVIGAEQFHTPISAMSVFDRNSNQSQTHFGTCKDCSLLEVNQ